MTPILRGKDLARLIEDVHRKDNGKSKRLSAVDLLRKVRKQHLYGIGELTE